MIVLSYIFNLLALLMGVFCYMRGRKDLFCVIVYLVITSFISLVPVNGVPPIDWALLICFAAFLFEVVTVGKIDGVKNDFLGRSILLVVGYIAIRSIFSLFLGEEKPLHIALTIRAPLFWMTYFVFKKITLSDLEKSWKKIFVLVLVANILTLSQMIGFDFGNYHARSFGSKLGVPLVIDTVFFWVILTKKINAPLKILSIATILIDAVFASRFYCFLITFIGGCAFFIPKVKLNKKISLAIVVSLLAAIFIVVFKTGTLNNIGRFGEIQNDIQGISEVSQRTAVKGKYLESGNSATMLFRLVLAKERFQYLLRNPQYMIWGVGPIYDDPSNPNNRFDFYLGTRRSDLRGIHQIDTVDISFVTHIFRYGLVGIATYVLLICCLFARLSNCRDYSVIIKSSFLTMILFALQSIGANRFDRFQFMFFVLLTAGVCYNVRKHELLRNSHS